MVRPLMSKPLSALVLAALLGCSGGEGPSPRPAESGSPAEGRSPKANVVARVNGAPITEADVDHRLQGGSHEAAAGGDQRKSAIDYVVTREVLAQKAEAEGLDRDPKYQEGLQKLLAQVAAYRRQELSDRLLHREAERRTSLSDEDARAYFQKNEKRIRTRLHVLQILRRSEAAIIEARSAIERGKTFEQVARELFPGLPEGQTPWDLGYLPFHKVPEPWRGTVYDLKAGEMSGILRGPNERFWLVKVVEVQEDPSLTFESVKEAVIADMMANKVQRSREELEKDLVAGAKIELLSGK